MAERSQDHHDDSRLVKRRQMSHMWLHSDERHEGEMRYRFKVLDSHPSSMQCQISEAVKIKLAARDGIEILNNKAEYNRCLLPELEVKLGRNKVIMKDETTIDGRCTLEEEDKEMSRIWRMEVS